MSQRAFELLLTIMRRAFSGQSLLAKDQNWIQRTDSTIQQGAGFCAFREHLQRQSLLLSEKSTVQLFCAAYHST